MPSTGVMSEKWYEKHASVLLFLMGLLLLLSASMRLFILRGTPEAFVTEAVSGMTWKEILAASPSGVGTIYATASRAWGIVELGFGILVMAIAWIPFRNREKWAWYALWLVPVEFVGGIANSLMAGLSPSIFFPLMPKAQSTCTQCPP